VLFEYTIFDIVSRYHILLNEMIYQATEKREHTIKISKYIVYVARFCVEKYISKLKM